MIWHAHIPFNAANREVRDQHLARVLERVRRGGSLAKILGAKSCHEALRKINAFMLPLMERAPDEELARLEALRVFLLDHLSCEFTLGIEGGVPRLRQLGTLQRSVAMYPKNRPRRKVR